MLSAPGSSLGSTATVARGASSARRRVEPRTTANASASATATSATYRRAGARPLGDGRGEARASAEGRARSGAGGSGVRVCSSLCAAERLRTALINALVSADGSAEYSDASRRAKRPCASRAPARSPMESRSVTSHRSFRSSSGPSETATRAQRAAETPSPRCQLISASDEPQVAAAWRSRERSASIQCPSSGDASETNSPSRNSPW